MKIVPIKFQLTSEFIAKLKPSEVEDAIKTEILTKIIQEITPMLDDESFVEMVPSGDNKVFDISLSVLIGSSSKYIEAIQQSAIKSKEILTGIQNDLGLEDDYSEEDILDDVNSILAPMSDLVK